MDHLALPLVGLFPLLFVGMWLAVTRLLAVLSGWPELERQYALERTYTGSKRRLQRGRIGRVSYQGTLVLGTDGEGIYLAVLALFGVGLKPCISRGARCR